MKVGSISQISSNDELSHVTVSKVERMIRDCEGELLITVPTTKVDGKILSLVSFIDGSVACCTMTGNIYLVSKDLTDIELLNGYQATSKLLLTTKETLIFHNSQELVISLAKGQLPKLLKHPSTVSFTALSPDRAF